jgi:quercetin dioxygenase-like cupin family protein
VHLIDLSADRAQEITRFASRGVTAVPCGDGYGEAHVYCLRFVPGGEIGPHEAGFGQLLLVVEGSGWVAGADGRRVELREGQAARIDRGEIHSKGSERGMTAIMVQVSELSRPGGVS